MDIPLNPPSRRLDSAKVRRAAMHPARPGAKCKADPGVIEPVVNHAKCEGKADCVAVCPYDVFEVGRIENADYRALPWLARLKVRLHGMQTAYTPHADRCLACGLCVVACPEGAIRLVERVSTPPGEPMRLFI